MSDFETPTEQKNVPEDRWKRDAECMAQKLERYKQISANVIVNSRKKERIKKAWRVSPDLIKWTSCVLYYRRSTNKQDTTIETQQKECVRKAKEMNLTISKEYNEEVSGKTDVEERTEMTKLMEEIKPGEVLIVYSVSRIARQVDVFYNIMRRLKDMGCRIICCHEKLDSIDPHMDMIWAVHVTFAQQERQAIGSRTSAALQTMKARGLAVHRPRWGQRIDPETKKFVPIPEIQEIINQMINMRRQGCSLGDIAKMNNDLQIPTPGGGGKWDIRGVAMILKRELGEEEAKKLNKKPGFFRTTREEVAKMMLEEEEEEEAARNASDQELEEGDDVQEVVQEITQETQEITDDYDSLSLPMLKLRIKRKTELGITDQDIAGMSRDELIFTLRYN